VQSNPVVKL